MSETIYQVELSTHFFRVLSITRNCVYSRARWMSIDVIFEGNRVQIVLLNGIAGRHGQPIAKGTYFPRFYIKPFFYPSTSSIPSARADSSS